MKADGIILSAGFSSRAGGFKPELDIAGKPLLVRTIESMLDSCEKLIVVGGHEFERVARILDGIPQCTAVKNENFRAGMFSSVKTGVNQVTAEKFFVLPGDQPAVSPSTFHHMMKENAEIVIPRYKGKKGHPVLFDACCIPGITAMEDTGILRDYIHGRNNVTVIDVDDPGIGMDVDTPQDLVVVTDYYRKYRVKN